jgi:hypothetical protein
MTIDTNLINAVAGASCTQGASFCGGIQSQGSTTTIINNVVHGASGSRTCAVLLSNGETATGAVILNGNTLDGAGNGNNDGNISAALALLIRGGNSATVGRVRNNILLGGLNEHRYGVFEEGVAGTTIHLAALENNDFWNAGTPKTDFAYRLWDGDAVSELSFAQLANVPGTPSNNLGVDPLLDATFHMAQTSPLVDKGTPTEAPARDLDGELRPKGPIVDIGADEAK